MGQGEKEGSEEKHSKSIGNLYTSSEKGKGRQLILRIHKDTPKWKGSPTPACWKSQESIQLAISQNDRAAKDQASPHSFPCLLWSMTEGKKGE